MLLPTGFYAGPPFGRAVAWGFVLLGRGSGFFVFRDGLFYLGDGGFVFTFLLDEVQRRKTTDRKRAKCPFAWYFLPYLYTKYVSFTSEYFSENTSLM